MKKYPSTQEMAEIFPSWAKIRNDDQSTGYSILNALGYHIDKMDKTLAKQGQNTFLSTVNLDEIDILHKVQLPVDFEFSVDNTDPIFAVQLPPTVSGYIDSDAYLVQPDRTNNIEEFWYNAIPNRLSLQTTVTGVDHNLLTFVANDSPLEVELEHHLGGGYFWIECTGGSQYLLVENGELFRARIILRGITRAGLEDSETLVFPWEMKQRSNKEWKVITKIEIFDMEPSVQVNIRSGNFNEEPYLDQYNARYSNNRRKIDSFWGLGEVEGRPTLDLITYQSDEWETIAAGFPDKQVLQSWELLDENNLPVSGIDLTLQRFSERAWITTGNGKLYYYDLSEDMVSGVNFLNGKTPGSHINLDYNSRYLVVDETFTFTPWHSRPLKEVAKYRIWYQAPSGSLYGIQNGSSVATTVSGLAVDNPKIWVEGRQFARTIADKVSVQLTERGEYFFVLETVFIDGETHEERVIAKTCYKKPLVTLDVSSFCPEVSGIDFDSDQKLWLQSISGNYYQIGLHYDTMLIDYTKKVLYFREGYDNVDVIV